MKKQTKKSFLDRIEELDMQTLVLYMVLIFSVCIVVWLFVLAILGNFQPSFTITTEECRNEIRCNQILMPADDSFGCNGTIVKRTEDKCDGNVCTVGVSYCLGIQKIIYYEECKREQVCEQKEVQKIVLLDETVFENCKQYNCFNLTSNEDKECMYHCYYSKIKPITKKYLQENPEFLDENCKCVSACHISPCAYDNETNSYTYWKDGCEKYSCGDYLVEVKE